MRVMEQDGSRHGDKGTWAGFKALDLGLTGGGQMEKGGGGAKILEPEVSFVPKATRQEGWNKHDHVFSGALRRRRA